MGIPPVNIDPKTGEILLILDSEDKCVCVYVVIISCMLCPKVSVTISEGLHGVLHSVEMSRYLILGN